MRKKWGKIQKNSRFKSCYVCKSDINQFHRFKPIHTCHHFCGSFSGSGTGSWCLHSWSTKKKLRLWQRFRLGLELILSNQSNLDLILELVSMTLPWFLGHVLLSCSFNCWCIMLPPASMFFLYLGLIILQSISTLTVLGSFRIGSLLCRFSTGEFPKFWTSKDL